MVLHVTSCELSKGAHGRKTLEQVLGIIGSAYSAANAASEMPMAAAYGTIGWRYSNPDAAESVRCAVRLRWSVDTAGNHA